MKTKVVPEGLSFLENSGEMGNLILSYDWDNSIIGPASKWPLSLKVTLGNMLASKFPMFLFWGPDLICFYNDAYRPSLGNNGKHPSALGSAGKKVFPEIWDNIMPLITDVLSGADAIMNEDLLLPIYRNDTLEDVYWTFCYSKALDDDGKINGVMVVCQETTAKVNSLDRLEKANQLLTTAIKSEREAIRNMAESEERFYGMAKATDILIAMGDEKSNAVYFNKAWTDLTGRSNEDLIGAGWVDLVHPADKERYVGIYTNAFEERIPFTGEFRVLGNDGYYHWLLAKGHPRYTTGEQFNGYLTTCVDITERKNQQAEVEMLASLVEASSEFTGFANFRSEIEYLNPTAMRKLGWESSAGRYFVDCIFPDDRELALKLLSGLQHKNVFHHEIRFWNEKTGIPFWIDWNVFTVKNFVTGETVGIATVSSDISDRRSQSDQLKITNNELLITRDELQDLLAKLTASEESFRSLLQSVPIAIALFIGPELVIKEPNQSFIDMMGKGPNIEGKRLTDVMPELIDQPFLEILQNIFITGEKFTTNGTQVKLIYNGTETNNYYDFTYTPLYNEKNEVYCILETAIDVTPQQMAKIAVQQSEEELRSLVLKAPIAMCLLEGDDFKVAIANDRMFELWGRDSSYILNKPIFEGLPEASGQGLEALLEQVYLTGNPYKGYEVPVTLPRDNDLQLAYVNFVYEAFRNISGEIVGIMVVGNDVTEQVISRKMVEDSKLEMQYTNDRLQLAMEAGELGWYELDLITDEIKYSERFSEIFEVSGAKTGKAFLGQLHPEDVAVRNEAHLLSRQTSILDYTSRLVVKGNRTKWVRIKGVVSFDAHKLPLRVLGIVQDISEAKELEFQKDSFLGIASHELKTPVTSIKAFIQVMENIFESSGDTMYAGMMQKIDKQVNKLTFLINDLLDVTKINSGRLQFNLTSFNFDEMVQEVAEDIRSISPKHNIILKLEFKENIVADKERLIQVVVNLMTNAVKYSPDQPDIIISTEKSDGNVQFCVQDFGIGIAEEKQGMIFEQFYRVSGSREHTFPGLGLGLYISANNLMRMGGHIWVRSEEGKGSTFCFSLPVQQT